VIRSQTIQDFIQLGLNQLEAEVYVHLIQRSPATGYAVAKAINRPNSNTYKAIASLAAKGAIWVDEGDSRLCRAVPPDELLEQMEHRFRERMERASASARLLASADAEVADDRVYQLSTVDQVYARGRRMLDACEELALVDAFPVPLERLRDAVADAVRRGVRVAAHVYEPVGLEGAQVVLHRHATPVLERWRGQWIELAVDGRQQLIALLSPDGEAVIQAVWTSSPVVSWSFQSCAQSDLLLSALLPLIESAASVDELRAEYRRWLDDVPYPDAPTPVLREAARWGPHLRPADQEE